MAHTITISTTKALHSDFKKAVYAAESNVSEVINAFMQSYIDGTQAEFNKLKDGDTGSVYCFGYDQFQNDKEAVRDYLISRAHSYDMYQ